MMEGDDNKTNQGPTKQYILTIRTHINILSGVARAMASLRPWEVDNTSGDTSWPFYLQPFFFFLAGYRHRERAIEICIGMEQQEQLDNNNKNTGGAGQQGVSPAKRYSTTSLCWGTTLSFILACQSDDKSTRWREETLSLSLYSKVVPLFQGAEQPQLTHPWRHLPRPPTPSREESDPNRFSWAMNLSFFSHS